MPIPTRRSLFLTGFMGAGKSTVGPALAVAVGLPFVDLDRDIEASTKLAIPAHFKLHGEAHFRVVEATRLAVHCAGPASVVALGGGTLLRTANRALVRTTGTLIYLQASLTALWQRTAKSDRPLLQNKAGPDAGVRALFAAREPGYLSAEIRVATEGHSVDAIVDTILKELAQCDA